MPPPKAKIMNEKKKRILLGVLDVAVNLGVIAILVVIIQTWIIAPFDVSGSSMCDTLNVVDEECHPGFGEKIIINEALYLFNDPERGDIVVFKAPGEGEERYFIKRVIGLPGDEVEIKSGEVYLKKAGEEKSEKMEENYLNENNKGNTKTYYNYTTFSVPEGSYFVMGDNRNASTDSRSCFQGEINGLCSEHPENAYVSKDRIRGKAWVVWWPLGNMRVLGDGEDVYQNSQSLEEK